MAINVTKPAINLREKLNEVTLETGIKGEELLNSDTSAEARNVLELDTHLFTDFESTGIDDNATSTKLATTATGIDVTGTVKVTSTGDATLNLDSITSRIQRAGANIISATNAVTTFAVNGSEKMRIDSAGKVGIGTSSPVAPLNVQKASGGGEILRLRGGSYTNVVYSSGLSFSSSAPSNSNRYWDISTTENGLGFVRKITDTNGTSGAVTSITTTGIAFNGDTAAANALDDYEEGTFTPILSDATSGGNVSPTAFTGFYTKIGNIVHTTFQMFNIDTTGMTAGNPLYVQGLPYVAKAGMNHQGSCTLDRLNFTGFVTPQVSGSTNYVFFNDMRDSNTEIQLTPAAITVSGGSDISMVISYKV